MFTQDHLPIIEFFSLRHIDFQAKYSKKTILIVVAFKNSCIFATAIIILQLFCSMRFKTKWPVRLSARTPGFHPGKRGSIPLRATKLTKKIMANHKSALKRIRSNNAKRILNKYQHKTTRNAIKSLRELTSKKKAEKAFSSVASMIDKLAKRNIIHNNKAANLKSKLMKHIANL